MRKAEKKLYMVLTAGLTFAFLFIDLSVSLGFLFGSIVSLIMMRRTERFCTMLLSSRSANKGLMALNFMINFGLMALTLIICALKPDFLNIFGAAMGLLSVKLTIILNALLLERRKNNDPS